LVNIKYGKAHQALKDGNVPVYGSGGLMRYAEKAIYENESVLIPRKGTLNNVMYVNEPFWTVDTMFYSETKIPHSAIFVYQFLKTKDLASMNAGTAVPSMTIEILNKLPVVIPPEERLLEFDEVSSVLYNAIKQNDKQSRVLAAVRDTLLSPLMSGEIEVEI
jgi:type I restriction enzyme S subunit